MKMEWNKKYTTIAVYALIVMFLSISFYLFVSEVGSIKIQINKYLAVFQPIFTGLIMAYLFNFILDFYEDLIRKKMKIKSEKFLRLVGMILTYLTVTLALVLFLKFILPQLINSIGGLVNNIPSYLRSLEKSINKFNESLNLPEEYLSILMAKWNEFINKTVGFATELLPKIGNTVKNVLASIWNIILGLIISIYLLADKENFKATSKKLLSSIFSEKNKAIILNLLNRADSIFGRFLSGKILDSLIIGILTFVILKVVKMPYSLLVSFIVGLTNIIPFFGPFIGAIPCFFIILFESPVKAFSFLLIILIIQQIDGNIIGPKILGDSLGISAFWILFSLLVAGKLLGFVGLVIGVPLFVFIYSIIKDLVDYRLKKKGLSTDTEDYL